MVKLLSRHLVIRQQRPPWKVYNHEPPSLRNVGAAHVSARVFPTPMVDLGVGSHLDHVPAGPGGPTRTGAAGGRRYGHRAPRSEGVWQGTASRWGAVDPQL